MLVAVAECAIHSGLQAVSRGDDFITLDLILPLIALALLLLVGAWMRRRVEENKEL